MEVKDQIKKALSERKKLEKILTKDTQMAAAQFCQRSNSSTYLSCYIDGIKRNRYVKKSDEKRWKELTNEWKSYSNALKDWHKKNKEIEQLFKKSVKTRLVALPEAKKRKQV